MKGFLSYEWSKFCIFEVLLINWVTRYKINMYLYIYTKQNEFVCLHCRGSGSDSLAAFFNGVVLYESH